MALQPPPQSKSIDFMSVVAALDTQFKVPQVVYEFPNGRKFKELPNNPAAQIIYATEDGSALYAPSGSAGGNIFYRPE
jgi:hypothetical protein